jgi:hypothetical protein
MRSANLSWLEVARYLSAQPNHTCINVRKMQVEHPQGAGMRRSLGLPVGQYADWRLPYPNCHGLHVREYADRYTAHIDRVNPNCDLGQHVVSDTPALAGGAALGAIVGLALGESPAAMLVGALFGGAVGAAIQANGEAQACGPRKTCKR